MKKVVILSILVLAAAMFSGCKTDEDTSLSWTNSTGDGVKDIAWKDVSGSATQTWSENAVTANNETTSAKKIEVLTGTGECVDKDGNSGTITLLPGEGVITASTNSATIDKGTDANLIISNFAKK